MDTEAPFSPCLETGDFGLPDISDEEVRRLSGEIDRSGFGVIKNYLPAAVLARAQAYVEAEVAAAGGEYVGKVGKQAVSGSVLDALSDPGPFERLLRRVYETGAGRAGPQQSVYQVLRCLKGKSGMNHSMFFHYDSYVVTALVPIIIPTTGKAGHLIMRPNFRPVRSNYLFNAIDKVLLDNKLSQRLLAYAYNKDLMGLKRVAMVPGDLYFFWGYRTIHANEPCDPETIRATALFHYGDPHADSSIRRFTGKAALRAGKA